MFLPSQRTVGQESMGQESIVHPKAHAHNDYEHDRPLLDAIDNGFRSVEADVFLVNGELLVAHDPVDLSPERTLQRLYLDPLREFFARQTSAAASNQPAFTLLIDLKSDGATTYLALNQLLSEYDDLFTHVDSQGFHQRNVQAIISGNRPMELVRSHLPRFAGVDGRLSDLESNATSDFMPLISDHWGRNFQWRGEGELPEDDREKLRRILRTAHANQQRVRFWATPDHPHAWKVLDEAGVDLINTDDLEGLHRYFESK
ncbi:phosphatidylinositol-specific phospholipase C/glycerophosphodiester phosphodiesterase family protein [Rhodopirellula sp. JC740]|uniref:Altered inheritance of mitochondria protein 6 n=1 Tax=Rhodopirellula halodulae TaxID=2894198 RepID=A0ABS8NED8_9BACT|nr:phosphatidylinositol-specific phospholipase C/glycerophosphodiester phosphodiesterase family protein [Rhodopirellula sp. JC740]MCC9641911.1 phosphatidylinositol-specific phospholipase C/glycerophosphodiester phosphodiesterase family protein [Rhodopirellula sp. JC740]